MALLVILFLPCFVQSLLHSSQSVATELHLAVLGNKRGDVGSRREKRGP